MVAKPREVGLAVRGIDDQQEAIPSTLVDDQVVDDSAVLVGEERVLGLSGLDPVEIVREQSLQILARARAFDLEFAHMRDVEDAAVAPHREVLRDHALVLHRHLPAGEGNQACAEGDMPVEQGRAKQRLHRPLMLKARAAPPPGEGDADQKGSRPGFDL